MCKHQQTEIVGMGVVFKTVSQRFTELIISNVADLLGAIGRLRQCLLCLMRAYVEGPCFHIS